MANGLLNIITPEQILQRRQQEAQRSFQQAFAGDPRSQGLAFAGGALGNLLRGFAERQGFVEERADPELERARANAEVVKQIQDENIDLGTSEGMLEAARRFRTAGNLEQSLRLIDAARGLETTGLRTDLLREELRIAEETTGKRVPKDVRTTLQKNLEAAGFVPGTPEYSAAIKDSLQKRGTNITINQTEGQRRDQFMATQINDAVSSMQQTLQSDTFNPTSIDKKVIDLFGSWANFAKSDQWQAFEGDNNLAIEMFLNKTTGASYTPAQKESAEKRFKINPGDNPRTIRLKLERIQKLRNDLRESAGLPVEEEVQPQVPVAPLPLEAPETVQPDQPTNRFEGFSIVR